MAWPGRLARGCWPTKEAEGFEARDPTLDPLISFAGLLSSANDDDDNDNDKEDNGTSDVLNNPACLFAASPTAADPRSFTCCSGRGSPRATLNPVYPILYQHHTQ